MSPLFQKVRYTPLGEKPWARRSRYVRVLTYAGIGTFVIMLLIIGLHFFGVQKILPIPEDGGNHPPPPPEPEEGLLGVARGPEIVIPEIPKSFQTVGVVFYGRRSRVEILDCYLKVCLAITKTTLGSTADHTF